MLGHALGTMNRQAFKETMRDMVSKERMKADDIRKPECQHDETDIHVTVGIVSYWMSFQTSPIVCLRPPHMELHRQSFRLGVSSNDINWCSSGILLYYGTDVGKVLILECKLLPLAVCHLTSVCILKKFSQSGL